MAKIVRYNGNVQAFASAAPGTERTIFGDVAQSNDLTAQINADFLRGWGIVGPSDQPNLQDFNGAMYTHGQLLAYLHQTGVAEYNAAQEYHLNSICNAGGVLFFSKINNNTGNTPASSPAQWGELYPQATELVRGTAAVASTSDVSAGASDLVMVTPNKLKFGFAANFAASGYIRLPSWLGGFTIQWVNVNLALITAAGQTLGVNWPIQFNTIAGATFTADSSANNGFTLSMTGKSTTGAGIFCNAYPVGGFGPPGLNSVFAWGF